MKIIDTIKEELGDSAKITDYLFEGSEIILFTKSKRFFKTNEKKIKEIVKKIKKRIEVRADPSLHLPEEQTEKFIREVVPKEAEITEIYFEPELSRVYIHAKKPGLVIGKNGDTLKTIKHSTFWNPVIRRSGVIESDIVKAIRRHLHKELNYRKKFLNKVGKRIYSDGKPTRWIRVTALGAFREVGRSAILVQTPQSRVLLDAGVSPSGIGPKAFPYLDSPDFNLSQLDAIVISHAHLDHCGFLPAIYELGYDGPVYCTEPTRDLMALLQMDYIEVAQKEYGKAPYTSKGIELALKHCITLEYDEVTDITPDVRLTLENAGHLLGSASVHMNIGDGMYNLLYTADIKFRETKLLDPAFTAYQRVEGLIIESTYGLPDDIQEGREKAEERLVQIVRDALEKKGHVLIPSFAVGRAQDIIAILADAGIEVPIYLDGMIWDSTGIFSTYIEYMSKRMQDHILHHGNNPFKYEWLKPVGSQKERQEILDDSDPYVVIATSGMLNGGPAIEYLKRFSEDPNSALVFVGYQAEGTLGRKIQKGFKEIPIHGHEGRTETLKIGLNVHTIDGLSGHADRNELFEYISKIPKPRRILPNHGEKSKVLKFSSDIHKTFRVETTALRNLESARLR